MREVHNGITIADCSQEQHTAQPRIEQRACAFNSTVQVVIAAVPKFPSAVKRVVLASVGRGDRLSCRETG